jgi:hypothetical protein
MIPSDVLNMNLSCFIAFVCCQWILGFHVSTRWILHEAFCSMLFLFWCVECFCAVSMSVIESISWYKSHSKCFVIEHHFSFSIWRSLVLIFLGMKVHGFVRVGVAIIINILDKSVAFKM